jgi:hypothetical protein
MERERWGKMVEKETNAKCDIQNSESMQGILYMLLQSNNILLCNVAWWTTGPGPHGIYLVPIN